MLISARQLNMYTQLGIKRNIKQHLNSYSSLLPLLVLITIQTGYLFRRLNQFLYILTPFKMNAIQYNQRDLMKQYTRKQINELLLQAVVLNVLPAKLVALTTQPTL